MKPLVLYRNLKYQKLFDDMERLLDRVGTPDPAGERCDAGNGAAVMAEAVLPNGGAAAVPDAYGCANQLIELAADYGFEGNLWHCFLAFCLANHENAFSTACEIRGDAGGTLSHLARQGKWRE